MQKLHRYVAQRTANVLTHGVVGRACAAGRQLEFHVHHENFFKESGFPHVSKI